MKLGVQGVVARNDQTYSNGFIEPINHPCAALPGIKSTSVPLRPLTQKGPSTYLHAGAGEGWPYDHKAEDTFEVPPLPTITTEDAEYRAVFGSKGEARLILTQAQTKLIATFDTFADAQLAAEALNNHKGY